MAEATLPARSEVDPDDTWDLSDLYGDEEAWEADFERLEGMIPELASYEERLGESPETLATYLELDTEAGRVLSRLRVWSSCRSDEDTSNAHFKGLKDRVRSLSTRISEATSFDRPEIMAVPPDEMEEWLESDALAPYRFLVEKILRHRPYTLGQEAERVLALSGEVSRTAYDAFGQLHDADLDFGSIEDEEGEEVEVTHGRYRSFLQRRDRGVRRRFFETYYEGFEAHRHTLAATLGGAVRRDVFHARARGFDSAREAALFRNHIPVEVYDNLVETVHERLELLYRYYELRRRALDLDEIHFWDCYVPIVPSDDAGLPFDEAVDAVCRSLAPMGDDYVSELREGLLGGWVDRFENRGKRSGAYSSGCYDSDPFILMNYRDDTLSSLYTLSHEAGHSMHSHLANRTQPPQYAGYSIFVAEVASTFHEALLTDHLLDQADDPARRAYLINREIDNVRGTLFRQTMFAEFEQLLHERVEAGKAVAIDDLTGLYREILERWFGPDFTLDEQLDLECLRIPHFYYGFYVYQYATGISAAFALARKVREGGRETVERYQDFLRAGSSDYPIEVLREAGVDMTEPDPIRAALERFERLLDELEELLPRIETPGATS